MYLVGTTLNSMWWLRVNPSRSSQSRIWNVGCIKATSKACGYHPDQVSLPLPLLTNPLSLIIGTHVGAIYLPSVILRVMGQKSPSPLLCFPGIISATRMLRDISEINIGHNMASLNLTSCACVCMFVCGCLFVFFGLYVVPVQESHPGGGHMKCQRT